MDKPCPQHVSFADFCAQAVITPLENHPRAGRVTFAGFDMGFVDALGQAGLRQAHAGAVNNALYAHDGEAPGFMKDVPLPTPAVLGEYPDMRLRFPNASRHVDEAAVAGSESSPCNHDDETPLCVYTPGDRVTLVYDRSAEGRVDCEVVSNDGAWIVLAPMSRPRRCQHFLRVCAVSGQDRYGGKIERTQ